MVEGKRRWAGKSGPPRRILLSPERPLPAAILLNSDNHRTLAFDRPNKAGATSEFGDRAGNRMRAALQISRAIDKGTALIGQWVTWLILAAILVSAANATSRKLFSISSNAYLELQWYLFGAAYLLAAAYTLQRNEHVRIDIVSNLLPKAVRNWIDLLGHLFVLLPFTVIMVRETWPAMARSYALGETSSNYGGLIVWPAKAFILLGFVLLMIQAVSEIIKRLALMRGLVPEPTEDRSSHLPVE